MTLAEARNVAAISAIRRLAENDFALLWIGDFWDGPISGMLKLDGTEFWFEMVQESEDDGSSWYRRYVVVRLSDAQLAREKEVHADFQRFVGTHWDCDVAPEDRRHQPKDQWAGFYDKHGAYYRERRFEECEVVAWFER